MSAKQLFSFRKFQIAHHGDTYPVGTDSILLGSWCSSDGVCTALDIGTGSGVLALMLAQRNADLVVDAVEIREEAAAQARENFTGSPWDERLRVICADISDLPDRLHEKYDLIISNPPYFSSGLQSPDVARKAARQGDGYTGQDLPAKASRLLTPAGILATVIPDHAVYPFIEKANAVGLYVSRRLGIRHTEESPVSVVLLELTRTLVQAEQGMLVLFRDGLPTQEYRNLTSEFITLSTGRGAKKKREV